MSITSNLYRLQMEDSRLDALQRRLDEITAALADDSAIRAAAGRLTEAQAALEAARQAQKRLEDELAGVRLKKSYNQQQLYSGKVRNPKALQDLQEEAAALDRRIADLEEQVLEAMIAREEAEAAWQAAETAHKKAQEEAAVQHARLLGEKSQIENEMARLQAQREIYWAQLSPDLQDEYEALRKRKNGIAVSKASEGACGVCGSELTPSRMQEARNSIAYCPACQRILYIG